MPVEAKAGGSEVAGNKDQSRATARPRASATLMAEVEDERESVPAPPRTVGKQRFANPGKVSTVLEG